MSRKNKKSIIKQAQDVFDDKLRIGESKHLHKRSKDHTDYIFGWSTYRSYLKHACYFLKWAKDTHQCKTLEQARPYANEWLLIRKQTMAPHTQHLESNALAKLYGCSTKDFIKMDPRRRKNITRSRKDVIRDKNFSESNNADLIHFCKHTGLRREDLQIVQEKHLKQREDGQYYLLIKGKGGKIREVVILDQDEKVISMLKESKGKLFPNVHQACDAHSYRADYATALYNRIARDVKTLKHDEIYYCRGDLKGVWYDKQAMLVVSRSLGHERLSVIAAHYLRAADIK